MKINNLIMNSFAELSYLNLDDVLWSELEEYGEISLHSAVKNWIDNKASLQYEDNQARKNHIDQILKELEKPEYANIKIIKYENQNHIGSNSNGKKTGLVAYAFDIGDGRIITSIRGSEGTETAGNKLDWNDNFATQSMITPQQYAAKQFIEDVGNLDKYNEIYLTGHSKGGNNVLFSTIACNEMVRDKIKGCYTFNAPGFSRWFIIKYKDSIKEMESIIYNYQNKYDFVSSVGLSIGKVFIVKSNYDVDKELKEIVKDGISKDDISKAIDAIFVNHYNFSYLTNDNGFVLEESQTKSILPNIVNFIVQQASKSGIMHILLVMQLLIATVSQHIKDTITQVKDTIIQYKYIIEQLIKKLRIKELIKEGYNEVVYIIDMICSGINPGLSILKFISNPKLLSNLFNKTIDFEKGIKDLMSTSVSNILELGRYTYSKVETKIENMQITIKNNYNKFTTSVDKALYNITYTAFEVDIESVSKTLSVYKTELNHLKNSRNQLDQIIEQLVKAGWKGNSKNNFYRFKYDICKMQIDNTISRTEKVVSFLEEVIYTFRDLKDEEDRIARALV